MAVQLALARYEVRCNVGNFHFERDMVQDTPHQSRPCSEPMLDAAWRAAADQLSIPGIVISVVLGLAGGISLAVANRFWPVAAACVILAAFGAYAAVVQPAIGGAWLRPSTQRLLA